MKQTVKFFLVLLALAAPLSCVRPEIPQYEQQTRFVTGVYVSSTLTLQPGDLCTIQAAGVKTGDVIVFRTADRARDEVAVATLAHVSDRTATFVVPDSFGRGSYYMYVRRGGTEQFLAACTVYIL